MARPSEALTRLSAPSCSNDAATATQQGEARGSSAFDYAREILITRISIGLTFLAWAMATQETFAILWSRIQSGSLGATLAQVIFIAIINLLIYGNFVYQFTRLGYLKRRMAHRPASREEIEAAYDREASPLTILVPSYKEEFDVVRGTLLSAALQDYPNRRVVLLIDDPHNPADPADKVALNATRQLPVLLQGVFDSAAAAFKDALSEHLARRNAGGMNLQAETARAAQLYREAATWFERHAADFPIADPAGAVLLEKVLGNCRELHIQRARELDRHAAVGGADDARLLREYRRLAALFQVELASFERKRYTNLSHEPNKAMNLNSYIALMGEDWSEVARHDGIHLEPAEGAPNAIRIPHSDYLITLDADSLLVPDYALRLVDFMSRPENARVAVAQTPYSAFPGASGELERVAGATTDIQYIIHQGFTRHRATFWVGANALLRTRALDDIRTVTMERGFPVAKYIQDRTVIEDTESSIDLVDRGWQLYNYPERMAYSATPPDFGSLLIQRRRWANGGLIILPKLVRYLLRGPVSAAKIAEGFFRVHYLGSIAAVNIGLLIVLAFPFEHSVESAWLPLTALPYFFLYGRDLVYAGYRWSDLIRVYALNLLLIPINLGGVFKSIEQAITGKQIPFGRTPKVTGRTAAPPLYIAAEYVLLGMGLLGGIVDVAHGRWGHALFSLANAAMLAYAIDRFIGFAESREDLVLGLQKKTQPRAAAALQPAYSCALEQPAPAELNLWAPAWALPRSGGQHAKAPAVGEVNDSRYLDAQTERRAA